MEPFPSRLEKVIETVAPFLRSERVNGQRHVWCSECYVVSNECDEPEHCLVQQYVVLLLHPRLMMIIVIRLTIFKL